jgi:hypothetical protein
VVAEHRFETGHRVDFSTTSILDKAPGYMACMMKEAVKIRLIPETSTEMEGAVSVWYLVTSMIK